VTCPHTTDIGVYVLGSLEPAERAALEAHLPKCDLCRAELVSFAGLPGLLSRVSPQEAAAGLPPTRPELLDGLLARAAAQRRTRRQWLIAVAAGLILLVGGIIGGVALAHPSAGGMTTDAANGPVHARVHLVGASSGTKITIRVTGVPPGAECRLVAIGKDGSSHDAGSWYASYSGDASVHETAALAPAELAALRVETPAGGPLVTIPLDS
jgi:anti-sigma factor RsiW